MRNLGFAAILAAFAPVLVGADGARVPVLVELFTSEGCSSCPPADRLLETLDRTQPVAGTSIIVLSEHVDYWNQLGWADPFSSAESTRRQQEYAGRFRLAGVYTPQMVVDGRAEMVGSDSARAAAEIRRSAREGKVPVQLGAPARDGSRVSVHVQVDPLPAGSDRQATVYVAMAQDRAVSKVSRGENAGRELAHIAVVRSLTAAGSAAGNAGFTKDVTLPLPSGGGGAWRIVAFVQGRTSGRVLGVAERRAGSLTER